jgi:Lipoprotein LpqB beta-propeller domain
LFASNRTGPMGLWSLPIAEGRPTGAAILLRPDIGPVSDSLGVIASGALVLGLQTSGPNIYTATMNPENGKLLTPVTALVDGFLRSNREPAWAPDGKSLVYLSMPANGPSSLVVQSIDDGRTREVQPMMGWFLRPTWAPDGSIYVSGSDVKGRRGVHRVDLATSNVSQVVVGAPGRCPESPSLSLDGRLLVYLMQCQPESAVMVRDVASGIEREVGRARGVGTPKVSPDGSHVAYLLRDEATKSKSLLVVPTTGGTPRELVRTTDPVVLGNLVEWSADSRSLLTGKVDRTSTKSRAMLVPLDGGMPVELDAAIPGFRVALHPDGRRVAFSQGETAFEVRTVPLAGTPPIRR